jgi:hypothetical protein
VARVQLLDASESVSEQKIGVYEKGKNMSASTIVMIILILLLLGALPTWPYSSGWGYYPSGGLGLVLVIVIVLLVLGRI